MYACIWVCVCACVCVICVMCHIKLFLLIISACGVGEVPAQRATLRGYCRLLKFVEAQTEDPLLGILCPGQWTCRAQWNDKGSWAYAMHQMLQGPSQLFTCPGDYIGNVPSRLADILLRPFNFSLAATKDVSWAEVGESESRWLLDSLDLEDFTYWLVFTDNINV